MAKILCIGIATVDIINSVEQYPKEDAEIRAFAQRCSRGGNATNTLSILSQLGHHSAWAGNLALDNYTPLIEADLNQHNIDMQHVVKLQNKGNPVSCIVSNQQNASRTIVHYRDLPEYSYTDFCAIDCASFDWIHFEARNIEQLAKMMQLIKTEYPKIQISLEVEKPREYIEHLYPYPDVLLYSRQYAQYCGFNQPADFLRHQQKQIKRVIKMSCTWGEEGALLLCEDELYHSKAYQVENCIDTLAAGDTFNAGLIHAMLMELKPQQQIEWACKLAGIKCAHQGLILPAKEIENLLVSF